MAASLSLEVIEFGPVRFIGKVAVIEQGKNARAQWKAFLEDGSNEILQALPDRVSPPGDTAGWMGDYNPKEKTFIEIPGVFTKPDTAVPEGFGYRDMPKCTLAILRITGDTHSLERGAHNKCVKLMREQGYDPDYSLGFSMEYYSYEKYANVSTKGGPFTFAYLLPCKKAEK